MTHRMPAATISMGGGGSSGGSGTFAAGGDLSGTDTNQTVIGLRGRSITSAVPTTGQVYQYNGTAWAPASIGSFTAGGDLTGTSSSQTVAKINGASVTAAGSLTTGHVLQVSGASATSYGYVANANVDAAAAIAGTKIDPDFGSQDVTTTGFVAAAYFAVTNWYDWGSSTPRISQGSGAPSASDPNGSIYLRTDGTSSTGIYTRQGGAWSAVGGGSAGWALAGNSGTTAGTDFVGTTDAIDLVFKTNNAEVGRFISGGGFRLPYGQALLSRNLAGSANIVMANVGGSDNLILGAATDVSSNSCANFTSCTSGAFLWRISGGIRGYLDASTFYIASQTIDFNQTGAATAVVVRNTPRASDGACGSTTIRGQAAFATATGSNRVPGSLILEVTAPTNSGTTHSTVSLRVASDDVAIATKDTSGNKQFRINTRGQTTVGAAGAASALPANPSRYLYVVADDGNEYVLPLYAAA